MDCAPGGDWFIPDSDHATLVLHGIDLKGKFSSGTEGALASKFDYNFE